GHAKGGMWGNILVGIKPGSDMKMPVRTEHVHSPDEDKMDNMPGMKKDDKKARDMANMPGMDHGAASTDMKMSSVTNIGDPMNRESSGTSWASDSAPVYARMKMKDDGS